MGGAAVGHKRRPLIVRVHMAGLRGAHRRRFNASDKRDRIVETSFPGRGCHQTNSSAPAEVNVT
jgi:hypothetical protein